MAEIGFYYMIATSVVGTFAVIASLTPNKSDDKIAAFLQTAINVVGFNFGNAKNAD